MPCSDLQTTLSRLARTLDASNAPWMLIGGAALSVRKQPHQTVPDIDVVVTPKTAQALSNRHGWPNLADGGTGRFKSDWILKPNLGPTPVEILGGFRVKQHETWTPVAPTARQLVLFYGASVWVPTEKYLVELLALFNRPKDHHRASALLSEPNTSQFDH